MKQDASKENFGLGEPFDNFNQLLKSVRRSAGLSAQKIAQKTGVHINSQSFYENSKRDPSVDYLVSYSRAVGIPFWQLVSRRIELGDAPIEDKHAVLNEVGPMVKHFGQRYQGYRVAENDGNYDQPIDEQSPTYRLMTTCYALIERFEGNDNITVMQHDGSSMSPTVNDGDSMVVDSSCQTLTEGDVYVFKNGEVFSAKRIQLLPGGGVMLVPDNPQYRSVSLNQEDVEALDIQGKLVGSVSFY